MPKVRTHITPARLKSELFWTDSLIKTHLGEPDDYAVNPNYRSGPEMKLYELTRVKKVSRRKAVRAALENVRAKRELRSATAKRSIKTRRDNTVSGALKGYETCFEDCSYAYLRKLVLDRNPDRVVDPDRTTLVRWMVNFARHELTTYDNVRITESGKVGVHEAAEAVRNAVLDDIAAKWPQLKNECARQKR